MDHSGERRMAPAPCSETGSFMSYPAGTSDSEQHNDEPLSTADSTTHDSRLTELPEAPLIVSQVQNMKQVSADEIPTHSGAFSEVADGRLPNISAVDSSGSIEFAQQTFSTTKVDSQDESTLRYYDRDGDGRNEFPKCPAWDFFGDTPMVALLDSHVIFAQECLNLLKHAANILAMSPQLAALHVPLSPKTYEDVPLSLSCKGSISSPSSRLLRPVHFTPAFFCV